MYPHDHRAKKHQTIFLRVHRNWAVYSHNEKYIHRCIKLREDIFCTENSIISLLLQPNKTSAQKLSPQVNISYKDRRGESSLMYR